MTQKLCVWAKAARSKAGEPHRRGVASFAGSGEGERTTGEKWWGFIGGVLQVGSGQRLESSTVEGVSGADSRGCDGLSQKRPPGRGGGAVEEERRACCPWRACWTVQALSCGRSEWIPLSKQLVERGERESKRRRRWLASSSSLRLRLSPSPTSRPAASTTTMKGIGKAFARGPSSLLPPSRRRSPSRPASSPSDPILPSLQHRT